MWGVDGERGGGGASATEGEVQRLAQRRKGGSLGIKRGYTAMPGGVISGDDGVNELPLVELEARVAEAAAGQ